MEMFTALFQAVANTFNGIVSAMVWTAGILCFVLIVAVRVQKKALSK